MLGVSLPLMRPSTTALLEKVGAGLPTCATPKWEGMLGGDSTVFEFVRLSGGMAIVGLGNLDYT